MDIGDGLYLNITDSKASWVLTFDETPEFTSTVVFVYYGIKDEDGTITANSIFGNENDDLKAMTSLAAQHKPAYLIFKTEKMPNKNSFKDTLTPLIAKSVTQTADSN